MFQFFIRMMKKQSSNEEVTIIGTPTSLLELRQVSAKQERILMTKMMKRRMVTMTNTITTPMRTMMTKTPMQTMSKTNTQTSIMTETGLQFRTS